MPEGSTYPAAGPLDGTETLLGIQAGETVQIEAAALAAFTETEERTLDVGGENAFQVTETIDLGRAAIFYLAAELAAEDADGETWADPNAQQEGEIVIDLAVRESRDGVHWLPVQTSTFYVRDPAPPFTGLPALRYAVKGFTGRYVEITGSILDFAGNPYAGQNQPAASFAVTLEY